MFKSYDCPYIEFHKKSDEFCNFCNNHGIRLKLAEQIDEKDVHFRLSKESCQSCKGLGYIVNEKEHISIRFGKKRKFIETIKNICTDCQGYKYVLSVINFYDCDNQNKNGKCTDGKILVWADASFKFYELPFWIDYLFRNNVKQLVSQNCPKCYGTSKLEKYRDVVIKKGLEQ
jgi:hypothetical protein